MPRTRSDNRAVAAIAFAIAAAAAAAPAPAHATVQREVCVRTATLLASPTRGIPVATLVRGEPVIVLVRGEDRAWVRVKTTFGPKGWLRASQVCRPWSRR